MSWVDELDERPDDGPDAHLIRYRLGKDPFDRFLVAVGVFLLCVGAFLVGVGVFLDQAWLAGVSLLAWSLLRRWMERRAVLAFNGPGRPTDTLDDTGFVG
jgi:hypothetical protein